MRGRGRIFIGIIGLFMLMTAAGCTSTTADGLYRLPQASREYLQLQEQIDAVLDSGAEYSPPVSGPNRQSVQLKDIDGDGQNEAIAFFRITGDKPLKIYIMKQTDGAYETVNVIEGDGTAIESIRYADMDADSVSELVVGWQMSAALSHMTIYSVRDNQQVLLAESDYSRLVTSDLNSDACTDVIVLRLPSPEVSGEADLFTLRSDGEVITKTSALSAGLTSISRIFRSDLTDGSPAIFVEGDYQEGGVVTDILCWQDDSIFNVFVGSPTENSEETVRSYAVYSTDINADGVLDVPSPRLLVSPEDKSYYAIDWYSYNRNGYTREVYTTYHNFTDDWYLILPEEWEEHITVRREDTVAGERTIVFTWLPDGRQASDAPGEDFLKIYTLSGENKEDRSLLDERFMLLWLGDVIYAAEVLEAGVDREITPVTVTMNFRLITPEWYTGVY